MVDALANAGRPQDTLFLPPGHDEEAAARLRAIGWRTVAALSADDDAAVLGCTHVLKDGDAVAL